MENFIILLESFLYFISLFLITKDLYGFILKSKQFPSIIAIIYITLFLIFSKISNELNFILFLLTIIINIISLKLSFSDSRFKHIISSYIFLYCINLIISFICSFSVNQITNILVKKYIGFSFNAVVLILLSVFLVLKKDQLRTTFRLIPLDIKRISLISIIASTIAIGIFFDYGTSNSIAEWHTSVRILIVLLIAIIGSVFPVLIANSIGKSFYNRQAKMFEEQIQIQAQHYEEQARSNFELRRFKHDYNNMLIGVKKLIDEGNTTTATQLLEKESDIIALNPLNYVFDTGNGIVDAILTEKQKTAQEINTVISFEGAVPREKISPTDLCIIFGNTIDNAIEACSKLSLIKENVISVKVKAAGGYVFVKISNPTNGYADFNADDIKTSKEDTLNHGFGLYSLKKTIKKYDGSVNFKCSNNIFSVNLELSIPT